MRVLADEAGGHPLAGVLNRLMSRERGLGSPPNTSGTRANSLAPETGPERSPRRMLVVAGLGPSVGSEALLAVARWALKGGRKVAVVDFGHPSPGGPADLPPAGVAEARETVPFASVPCGLDGLRREAPSSLAAVAERLRRHESEADLVIVRVPAEDRLALSRAAFLAGGLIVPLDGGDGVVHAAFCLSREFAESLPAVVLVPHASDPAALDLYTSMVRDFLGEGSTPVDEEDAPVGDVLLPLAGPPEGGFLPALLSAAAAGTPSPPRLLDIGTLNI
ncbi:MAG: hypothetical protein LAO51_02050 [Acidobacteriia bacterium]|nr:hypothetical protein [Terriglobia bacterium]